MPDTRTVCNNAYMLAWFTVGQGGQYNQVAARKAFFDFAAGDRRFKGHLTITSVDAVQAQTRKIKDWHLTLVDQADNKESAMHWIYKSATDRYECKGWKVRAGGGGVGALIEPRIANVNPASLALLAELPNFEPQTPPRTVLIDQINQKIARKWRSWFGGAATEDASWKTFTP